MGPHRIASGIFVLLAAFPFAAARADVVTPGLKDTEPYLRFDNISDYPDYRFYLQYRRPGGSPYGSPLHAVELTSGWPVHLEGSGRRLGDVALLAVPRSLERFDPEHPPDSAPGVLRTAPPGGPTTTSLILDPTDHYVTPYRVALRDGKMQLTRLSDEAVTDPSVFPYWMAVLFVVLAVAALGVWFARRRSAKSVPRP